MELKRERQLSVEADGVDSDEESATPDWRVRAGPRNRPTQAKREEHEVTHVPFRDWCTPFMMGSGRTHHHATKQRSEDETRRPTFAMDYFFLRMQPAVNSRTISEEAITCIAVNEDRHHNLMRSVALKKRVEEPRTSEIVAKFIDLLGYREITLKSDTEPATVVFRSRVDKMCKAEVTAEAAVKGEKESNGLIEKAVMQIRGIIRTIERHMESITQEPRSDESPMLPRLVEHAGCILSRSQIVVMGRHPSKDCMRNADARICSAC